MFLPEVFFDLTNFPHSKLFQQDTHVWEALKHIWLYINEYKGNVVDVALYPNVFFENASQIYIEKDVKIEKGAYIKGPCIISSGCEIRAGAYIRGNVILGNNCIIGHSTEVVRSIFLNGAKAPHFNYVGDSILGNDVNLGAGFITANLRHDHKEIFIKEKNRKIATGLKKLGAIVGDFTKLGCNSVSNPGCICRKHARIPPCTSIKGCIE